MAEPNVNETPTGTRSSKWKTLVVKVIVLVVLGLLLGAAYDWAAARMYGPDRLPGFRLGVLHGALMPVALPTLLMGRDVPIYAASNTGTDLQDRLHCRDKPLRHDLLRCCLPAASPNVTLWLTGSFQ